MALVGFNYECECTSNREQVQPYFHFLPKCFPSPDLKKNKNKYLFSRQSFIDEYARFLFLDTKDKNAAVANSMNYMTKKGEVLAAIDLHEKHNSSNLMLISDLCNHEQLRVSLWYLYEIYHFWLFCPSYIIYQVHTAVLANQIKCKKLSKIFIISSLTARFTKLKISMRPLSLKSGDGSGKFCQWSSDNTIC